MQAVPPEGVSVWLVEDERASGLRGAWMVDQFGTACFSRRFGNWGQAIEALGLESGPTVLVCGFNALGRDCACGIRRLKQLAPETEVIVLAGDESTEKVFEAFAAGASGYLTAETSLERLVAAIDEVVHGGAPMAPRIARLLLNAFLQSGPLATRVEYGLTPREKQVLDLMVQGLVKKEIAGRLGVSFHTVNAQLRRVYEKLQVHTRSGAVAKAVQEALCQR